jgi:DNA-directed RNA polymerase subunit alpha
MACLLSNHWSLDLELPSVMPSEEYCFPLWRAMPSQGLKYPGVLHEFSTVEGVVEDVSEMILNLKMVRFKKISDSVDNKIVVPIKGQSQFKAGDITNFTASFEVLNPDHVICNLDEKAFELELNH